MSSSPPWLDSTTRGAPETGCLRPVPTSTSQMRPGFSVTNAALVVRTPEPGRKAIAHGELNVATGVATNGGSPDAGAAEAWLLVLADVPHAASRRSPACTTRILMTTAPLCPVNRQVAMTHEQA